jgi:mannose-1-phosphate guanylyltransferase/mannose-6-phosphate isomerase
MYPKQLLSLIGDKTMLQQTASRVSVGNPDAADAIIVCNEAHRFLVAEQIRAIGQSGTVVLEPEGRNTAPAVAVAAIVALKNSGADADAPLLLVMPADHVIQENDKFIAAIEQGKAAASSGKFVLFGIVPTSAHTGYGYIEADITGENAAPIKSFIEKPDEDNAAKMIDSNGFYWNAGIFLFRADSYLEELAKFSPDMVLACRKSIDMAAMDTDFVRPDADAFLACPNDSIDYAVMEKTDKAMVIPLDAGWNDVGSWAELHNVSSKDEHGNAISGDVVTHDCKDSFISGSSRLVTVVGLDNVVVVEDKDSVLVVAKDRAQDVKFLVDALKAQNREETKLHRQVFRPWGSYDGLDAEDGFQVKRLIVKPGAVLSLQKHAQRAEHWIVVKGKARITLDEKEFDLGVNESTYIPIGAVHRIANPFDELVHIIEVQCGDYLGEDDIVRLEDNYGREGTNT